MKDEPRVNLRYYIVLSKHTQTSFFDKNFVSIVLMAVVGSNYCLRYVDVKWFEHEGDSNILKAIDFVKQIYNKTLDLPSPTQMTKWPNKNTIAEFPYVLWLLKHLECVKTSWVYILIINSPGGNLFITKDCLELDVILL